MLALSFPPLHPLVLPFVGLVPLAVWVSDRPEGAAGAAAARRGGLLFGALYFTLLFHWVPIALATLGGGAIGASVAFAGIVVGLAALTSLFVGLLHTGVATLGVPLWLALPVTWTALEWTRAHLPSTLALPWLGLGTSLTAFPEIVGIAELIGARGVTFWLAAVNGLVATLVLTTRNGRAWLLRAAVTILVTGLPMGWGVWRARTLEMRPAGRVAVVQPDGGGLTSGDLLLRQLPPGSVDLVVLPEGLLGRVETIATDVSANPDASSGPDPDVARGLAVLQHHAREIGASILFGATGIGTTAAGTVGAVYNSAFVMDPRGLADYRYDKRHLVPVVERAPFLPTRVTVGHDGFGAYEVGAGWPLLVVDETRFGVLICYESSYPSAAREFRLEGADLLVNLTNDAWYGRRGGAAWTIALWQHPAHLVMRAIENRVGVARAADTGISLFVDPLGRVSEPIPPFAEGVRTAEVYTTDIVTFYTAHGDLLGNASAFSALLLFLAAHWRKRRRLDPHRTLV